MPTSFRTPTVMPIGYQQFHKQKFVNYQLNRAHALGYASTEELRAAAERPSTSASSLVMRKPTATARWGTCPWQATS